MPANMIVDRRKGTAVALPSRKPIPLLQSAKQRKSSIIKSVAGLLLFAILALYLARSLVAQFGRSSTRETWSPNSACQSRFPHLSQSAPSISCRIESALDQHHQRLKRQSRTVSEAVKAYEKRYRRKPPKHFEVWVDFALQHESALIDDFDQIDIDMAPFRKQKAMNMAEWKQQISKVKLAEPGEMLGSVSVIDGEAAVMGPESGSMSSDTLESLLLPIAPLLPDMTILYNWYAEPRILSSHSQQRGSPQGGNSFQYLRQRNDQEWYETSGDVFGNFTQLRTLDLLAKSCPSNTLSTSSSSDTLPLRDFCQSLKKVKSLDVNHGFFAGPDGFLPTYTLVPLLSRAKISTFNDILTPNVCYGHQDYRYWNQFDVIPFVDKSRSLYWRGSMTGLSTTHTNWIFGHRHRLIGYIQAIRAYIDGQSGKSASTILAPPVSLKGHLGQAPWTSEVHQALNRTSSSAFNAAFVAAPPNCPKDVCSAISEEMPLQKSEHVRESFKHQFVLDLDGQSMSCRFYSLLESNSVVFKQTIWGEWHDDRLIPWLHYIPIDIDLSKHEIPLYLDWFINTVEGQKYGEMIANESRKWTEVALRKIDLSIYLFRVLIEIADVL